MKKTFNVVIEKDEDGIYVGSVPELPGCHTQGATLKELNENIVEAIEAYLESIDNEERPVTKFLKMQKVEVALQ
ncbi:MAG: type II toxin-antitoxin system HicB family antitoxin [Candidatus Diapherotrites archaeon]|uniref:Type II toxin-antitoxin system HicB family antitoxin n=1 Tax=Candidatus Iainarchaeum sp. TaxID=3101447 RepID=A0A8T3YK60_9ARCH|nr:type II toxin-antitoxin system HicB family antitoxin [Candidatus Diapherotrites archaeon]